MASAEQVSDVLEVAIVGGGISGVYSAWRLKDAFPPKQIALFEGSDHIGGRLLSLVPPNAPHVRAEMGGMTYLSNQPMVQSLIEKKLNLPHQTLPPGSSTLRPSPNNLIYLRGSHFQFKDLGDLSKIPYRLDAQEAKLSKSPIQLVTCALQAAFPELAKLSGQKLVEGIRNASFDGLPLWHWGFWNIVSRKLSQEAYCYIRDTLGYDYLLMNFNAVDTMGQFFDIGGSPTQTKVLSGYQQLPLGLCKEFSIAGGQVYLRYRLKRIGLATVRDDKVMELEFAANNTGWGPTAAGTSLTVYAKRVILAMPRRSLEMLEQSGQVFGDGNMAQYLRQLLLSVTSMPMFKAYLCYHEPWWKRFGFDSGKAVTDLPLRQCFYWGIEATEEGGDPKNLNSVLMATFNDAATEPYWAGLSKLRALPHPMGAVVPNRPNLELTPWAAYRASLSSPLVTELQQQLRLIHQLASMPGNPHIPDPYDAAYIDWSADPFGGAHHVWNTGVQSWETMGKVAHPLESVPVYICGEAYSGSQGYVEGALETAETVLQSYFGLKSPDWISGPEPEEMHWQSLNE